MFTQVKIGLIPDSRSPLQLLHSALVESVACKLHHIKVVFHVPIQVARYYRLSSTFVERPRCKCSCIALKLLFGEARPGSHCCHSLALRLAIRPLSHKDTDRRHLRASRLHFPQNQQMGLGDEARWGVLFSRGGPRAGGLSCRLFCSLAFCHTLCECQVLF